MLFNIDFSKQKKEIEEYILSQYPKEACGLLTKEEFIPMENVSTFPEKSFKMLPEKYAHLLKDTIAIIHSHCKNPREQEFWDIRTPSCEDIEGQKLSAIPWLIFGTEGFTVTDPIQLPRIKTKEYLRRPFIWFIYDCYTLVQDFYKFNLEISLPDHKAKEGYERVRKGDNLFDDFIQEYGFKSIPLEEIKEGDLILLDNKGQKRNHLGIYTSGQVLHQDTLSTIVPFETFLGRINEVLHYEG